MTRVMLLDDEDVVRYGVRQSLEGEHDIEVVAETGSAPEAIALAGRLRPDVVLMEVQLNGTDGFKVARALMDQVGEPVPKIIVLTSRDLDEYLLRTIRMGLSGFLLKNVKRGELVESARAVAAGGAVICPMMTRRFIDRFDIFYVRQGIATQSP